MDACGYALFDTSIGRCALVWRGGLVIGAALPESSDEAMRRSLVRRFPAAGEAPPPPDITAAIGKIERLLGGAEEDLSSIAVDLGSLPRFDRDVLEATRRIGCGETRTYGEIASTLGAPGAARAVGGALGRNPAPIVIPCHRVLAADGRSGGFTAPGGVTTKMKMLALERARRSPAPELFDHLPLATKPVR